MPDSSYVLFAYRNFAMAASGHKEGLGRMMGYLGAMSSLVSP